MRVIYYWDEPRERVFLLLIFGKNEQGTLTAVQLARLRGVLKQKLPDG